MITIWQDLRQSARLLLKSPGFTLAAVITLALGIGANTALFTVINGILLRPLPFKDPDRLMTVWSTDTRRADSKGYVSYPDFLDLRAQSKSFERMAAWTEIDHTLTEGEEAQRVSCAWVTAEMLPLLGVAPQLGRFFESTEFLPKEPQAVIVSHKLWRDRFGAAPDLAGKRISINEKPYTVAGVMPAGFQIPMAPMQVAAIDVWMPFPETADGISAQRDAQVLQVIGRVQRGISAQQAQAEIGNIAGALRSQYQETNKYTGARVISAHEELTGAVRNPLFILLGAVGCVLLIACVNVAGLVLARGAGRGREMAVRAALGAGPGRIVRLLLTESLLLAVLGGACGVLLAAWGVEALLALSPDHLPRATEITLDGRVLAFTLIVSLIAGAVFGLAPAWAASGIDLTTALKEGARSATETVAGRKLRSALVVAEIALSIVLLAGAGLLARSFWSLRQVDPGFDSKNVLTLRLSLDGYKYRTPPEWAKWYAQLQERLQAIPGVRSASAVIPTPLSGLKMFDELVFPFEIEGRPADKSERQRVGGYGVQPGYFRTMGIQKIAGRDFTARDEAGAPAVAIVSEEFVRRYLPGEEALGKRMRMPAPWDANPPWREIVGVVRDVKGSRLDAEVKPEIYTPHAQNPFNEMYIAIKTDVDPHSVIGSARAAVQSLDKYQAFYDVRTMDERRADAVAEERFRTLLLGIFAALALILTAVGLYGVMVYTVTQRTREIGVRLALGAQPRDVMRLVLKQGMILTLAGASIGLIAAIALTRLMKSLLFNVSATDPLTFIVITMTISLVTLAACWLPARRATRVDPIVALRQD